MIIKNSKT